MDVDGDAERLRFFKERQVAWILRIPVLVNRRAFQPAQAEVVDVMFQLLHAVGVVRIHRAPANEAVIVLLHEVGNQLLICLDATERRPDAEHDDSIHRGSGFEQLFGRRIESVFLRRVAPGKIHIFRESHLRPLRLQRKLHKLIGQMIRVPHQVGMRVKHRPSPPQPPPSGRCFCWDSPPAKAARPTGKKPRAHKQRCPSCR